MGVGGGFRTGFVLEGAVAGGRVLGAVAVNFVPDTVRVRFAGVEGRNSRDGGILAVAGIEPGAARLGGEGVEAAVVVGVVEGEARAKEGGRATHGVVWGGADGAG